MLLHKAVQLARGTEGAACDQCGPPDEGVAAFELGYDWALAEVQRHHADLLLAVERGNGPHHD